MPLMSDETPSKSRAIIALAKELVEDIELSQFSAESLLLKTMRLARLVDAEEQQKWLAYELAGYTNNPDCIKYMTMMGRPTDTQAQQGYWEPLAQIEANISAMKLQMQTLRIPDVSYTSLHANYAPIFDEITISAPVNTVISKSHSLSYSIGILSGIRSRVISYIHTFVVSVYHEKMFSSLAQSIFERYKSKIDILLAQQTGDVLEKIPSIYNRLAEGDQEAISHAQSSCRRIIDAFADAVYPPTEEIIAVDGRPVPLNAANPRARINQYIRGKTSSQSRRDKLRQTLANLYNRVSTAVHNDVTPEEAQSLFLQTYLFLGEVLTLGEPPDSATVPLDSASPGTTPTAV